MFLFGKKRKKKKLEEHKRLHKINHEELVEEKELKPKNPVVLEPKEETKVDVLEPVKGEGKKVKPRKMSYHITKHADGGWQIKKGGAQRALKRFSTQKEAIEYAKILEKEKGASYLIHKADGKTRKKTY